MYVVSGSGEGQPGQSDLGLMKLVAEGDQHAQRVLAHRLAGRVQRVSRRLLSNAADAEDAAQLSLMEILRSAGGFREESSIERWSDRIAVRTSLRYAREQRRRPWAFGSKLDVLELPDARTAQPAAHRAADETPRALEDYLAELPSARREVLVLKHGLGYTTEEIAELTGKSLGTVKDRLVAARKQVRKLIQRETRLGGRKGVVGDV